MKGVLTGAMIIALVTASVTQAQTVTIFQTSFEPAEGYSTGDLNGQNGWQAFLGEDLNFGKVTNINPLAGSQSVLLDGQDVENGTFFYFAGVVHNAVIAPSLLGVPLRYVETNGLCKIVDPTVIASHQSLFYAYLFSNTTPVTGAGPGILSNGQYRFGWPASNSLTIPAQGGVMFQFRHLVDYHTGISRAWMNGQLAFQSSSDDQFNPKLHIDSVHLEGSSTHPDFDTRVWYDNLLIKAIYGCNADVNIDLAVNVNDLLAVISAWGTCPAPPTTCPANIVTAGTSANRVDVDDLLAVIGGWGPCL